MLGPAQTVRRRIASHTAQHVSLVPLLILILFTFSSFLMPHVGPAKVDMSTVECLTRMKNGVALSKQMVSLATFAVSQPPKSHLLVVYPKSTVEVFSVVKNLNAGIVAAQASFGPDMGLAADKPIYIMGGDAMINGGQNSKGFVDCGHWKFSSDPDINPFKQVSQTCAGNYMHKQAYYSMMKGLEKLYWQQGCPFFTCSSVFHFSLLFFSHFLFLYSDTACIRQERP